MTPTGGAYNFFDEGSPYLSHPLLTPARTTQEVDRILAALPEPPLTVLDIGCGFGRHAIELARRGCSVTAVDPSLTMVAEAERRAGEAGLPIEFRQMAGAELNDVDRFDLALCLFTTLGQQSGGETDPDRAAQGLLAAARTALVPGGTLVLEVQERTKALDFLAMTETLGPDERPTTVTRHFDEARNILTEHFSTPSAGTSFDLGLRLFTQAELIDELHAAGFEVGQIIDAALSPPPPTLVTVFATCPTG